MCLNFVLKTMWKADFQNLVPFVRSTEQTDSLFSKKLNPKCKYRQLTSPCETQGTDIRKFYENLVNSDDSISPWNDTIQNKNTITSEPLAHSTNNSNSNTCLKSSLDSIPSGSQKVTLSTTSAAIDTNSSVFNCKRKKTNIEFELPSNCKPVFCRNTAEMVKNFTHEHIQNLVLKCAQEGDLPGLKHLLKSGSVDLNCTDSFGWTPLMCASFGGHIDVVKFLLSLDKVDDRYRNKKGQSALGLSTKAGHCDIRKLLVNHRAPVMSSSSSSHKKEKAQLKSTFNKKLDQSFISEFFCDVCQIQVKNTTKSVHESSTVHLLSRHPQPLPESYFLSEQNRGFQIMVKKGWDDQKGLGPSGEGRKLPIKTILKRDRKGFGAKSSSVARVSHFDARDTAAVTNQQPKCKKSRNKKRLLTILRREKRKERHIRRCLDLN